MNPGDSSLFFAPFRLYRHHREGRNGKVPSWGLGVCDVAASAFLHVTARPRIWHLPVTQHGAQQIKIEPPRAPVVDGSRPGLRQGPPGGQLVNLAGLREAMDQGPDATPDFQQSQQQPQQQQQQLKQMQQVAARSVAPASAQPAAELVQQPVVPSGLQGAAMSGPDFIQSQHMQQHMQQQQARTVARLVTGSTCLGPNGVWGAPLRIDSRGFHVLGFLGGVNRIKV